MTTIALLIPSTNKNIKHNNNANNLPFIKIFLPSFLQSINKHTVKFKYNIYFGYDTNDSFYDNSNNMPKFQQKVNDMIKGYPIKMKYTKFKLPIISLVNLWNQLFKIAYNDNNQYFYQLGDDIRFSRNRWSDKFVRALRKSNNIGTVGPFDQRHKFRTLLTQSMVHRTHYQIFGYYFPETFKNICCDDWITHVYKRLGRLYSFRQIIVINNMKVRYIIDFSARKKLRSEENKAIKIVLNYLRKNRIK